MKTKSISIVGTGALGSVLARAVADADYAVYTVYSLYNQSESVANKLAESLDVNYSGGFPKQPDDLGEVVFLTVPDNHIKETASKIAKIGSEVDFKDRYFVHCSGTLTSEILFPLQKKGAFTASFHPCRPSRQVQARLTSKTYT